MSSNLQARIDEQTRQLEKLLDSRVEAKDWQRACMDVLSPKGRDENVVGIMLDICHRFKDRGLAKVQGDDHERYRAMQRVQWYRNVVFKYLGIMANTCFLQLARCDHEEVVQIVVGKILNMVDDLIRGGLKEEQMVLEMIFQVLPQVFVTLQNYLFRLCRPYHFQRALDRIGKDLQRWHDKLQDFEVQQLVIVTIQALFELKQDNLGDTYKRLVTDYLDASLTGKSVDIPVHLHPASVVVPVTAELQQFQCWAPYQTLDASRLEAEYFQQVLHFILRPTHQIEATMDDLLTGVVEMKKRWNRATGQDPVDFGVEEDEQESKERSFITHGWEKGVLDDTLYPGQSWQEMEKIHGPLDAPRWKSSR